MRVLRARALHINHCTRRMLTPRAERDCIMEGNMAIQNGKSTASNPEAKPGQDFDALLRERDFQSEFDRRVSRALETARGKWAQETERKMEQLRVQVEARARMTGEERMAHDFAERQKQLEARERDILRRELQADAMRMLQERGLPAELAGAVNYESAESLQQSLDLAENAFRSAVQRGVEKRLAGDMPMNISRRAAMPESDDDYYRARYASGGK